MTLGREVDAVGTGNVKPVAEDDASDGFLVKEAWAITTVEGSVLYRVDISLRGIVPLDTTATVWHSCEMQARDYS